MTKGLMGAVSAPFHFPVIGLVWSVILLCQVFGATSPGICDTPISGFNPASLANNPTDVFFDITTFGGNNVLPLEAIFLDKGWGGSFTPAHINNLDIYWKANGGAVYSGWRLAVFYRGELFAEANRDTVEILGMVKREENLPVGKTFRIDLDGKGFSATGLELSKGFRIAMPWSKNPLLFGLTARYMKGERIQQATIKGAVTPTSAKAYDFDLQMDYAYDQNILYDRKDVSRPTGDGYSFDVGLQYDFNDNVSIGILFRDIVGRIYWKDTPYTTADATSSTKYYNKDGYMEFRPIIRGYESYKDFPQKIPLKTDIVTNFKWRAFTMTPTINFIEDRPLYWIDIKHEITTSFSYDLGYNINYKTFIAGMAYKNAVLRVSADSSNVHTLKSVGVTISAAYRW
jgi:hypothetical protein